MNPERVLEDQAIRNRLRASFLRFAYGAQSAGARQNALGNSGVVLAALNFADDAVTFADNLTSKLVGRPISARDGDTHPLLQLLDYFLQNVPAEYGFHDADEDLFRQILAEGNYRSGAVRARAKVGKIEDERQAGIGTGVLVAANLLLTCEHVLSKTRAQQAWVRFDYKVNWDGKTTAPGVRFELDLKNPVSEGGGSQPDYVLLQLPNSPNRPSLRRVKTDLNAGQAICTIHHPGGKPAVVSAQGRIGQVGSAYIYHDLATEDGSSGAPIFDEHWSLVALHQGHTPNTPAGFVAGVPLYAFWDAISPNLKP